MSNKHTPGPWNVHGRDTRGLPHSLVAAETLIAKVYSKCYGDVEQETANAKLIAAAPDLLKALERIARPHDCGCVPCTGSCTSQEALQITVDEMRDLAKAAIARSA